VVRRAEGNTPWDRGVAPSLTPAEFEGHVLAWLKEWVERDRLRCTLEPQGVARGEGGDYRIDVLATLTLFDGARVVVLAECKHQRRRVERKQVAELEAKRQAVGAHKCMLFTTARFQAGALALATARGIFTATMRDGRCQIETRSHPSATPAGLPEWPPWIPFEPVIAQSVRITADRRLLVDVVKPGRVYALRDWFSRAPSEPRAVE
jgi:hypothetical protein